MWLFFAIASTLMWALVNVLDSLIVRNYEKNPFVLMWCQSLFSMVFLVLFPVFISVEFSSWTLPLMLFGAIGFVGDAWYFRVLRSVDISVTNAAWAILSIFLSIAGFLLFQESWTISQSLGSALVIGGVLFLSFFNRSTEAKRTLGFLISLALLYAPYYIMKKTAIDADLGVSHVFYWMLLGRELCAFNVPWVLRSVYTKSISLIRSSFSFSLWNAAVITCFLVAEYFGALSFREGFLSLVSVASNIQPFLVMMLAWLFAFFLPTRAPRELFTMHSVQVKLFSFVIVFVGLALLTVG